MRALRRLSQLVFVTVSVTAGVFGFGLSASAQANSTIVVDNTGDADDADTSDGVCQTAQGVCTLRAAISQANNNPGPDTIHFNIPGSGVRRIELGSDLPPINDPSGGVTIDGYTQPGSAPNTDPLTFNADIRIEIEGEENSHAFLIQSAENTIRGLSIWQAGTAIELLNEEADGNVIIGNMIGTDTTATYTRGGGIGVIMNTGPDQNVVGTADLADRNLISGSGSYGIRINHGESSQNVIQNNIIGLDRTGTVALPHAIGIDLQWWTWGNLIGGNGQYEGNLIGGNNSGGVDFSHMATGNNVLGNRIGTYPDGVNFSAETGNGNGVIIKDDPTNNYVANNIIRGNDSDGIWHKQNYTGRNTFANNVISNNVDYGGYITGHDDIYFNNIVSNNGAGGFNINNTSTRNNSNSPDQLTERTTVRLGHIYGNDGPFIRFGDSEAHPSADQASITGVGPGAVYGGDTCDGCTVDIYVSGSVNADGTVSPGPAATDWIALVATHSGLCVDITDNSDNPGADLVQDGCDLDSGQQFELVPDGTGFTLRANSSGLCVDVPNASTSNNVVVEQHGCNGGANQRLQWSGNSLVFAHSGKCLDVQGNSPESQAKLIQFSCNGGENQRFHAGSTIDSTWLGSVNADSDGSFSMASSALAEGVVVWAVATTPDGESAIASGHTMVVGSGYGLGSNPSSPLPAPEAPTGPNLPTPYVPETFVCSASNGVLSWSDAGASAYYVFANTDGTETYLGGQTVTSLPVAGADSYRVTHWNEGFATTALCDGPGPDAPPPPFSCTATNGVLSWDDAGANTYYIRSVTDGVESYVGSSTSTSLNVAGADSYIVIHWISGKTTATCDGPGPDVAPAFTCTVSGDTLAWDDAGASDYYVFAIVGGVDVYLGGHSTTSITVNPADSYRVTHWLGGKTTATCSA